MLVLELTSQTAGGMPETTARPIEYYNSGMAVLLVYLQFTHHYPRQFPGCPSSGNLWCLVKCWYGMACHTLEIKQEVILNVIEIIFVGWTVHNLLERGLWVTVNFNGSRIGIPGPEVESLSPSDMLPVNQKNVLNPKRHEIIAISKQLQHSDTYYHTIMPIYETILSKWYL